MFRWAASVSTKLASSFSDTFAPLFRSNLEQLQDAWKKVEKDCKLIMLDPLNAATSATGAPITEADLDNPQRLLESPLVTHLNQLVEALVKEEEEQGSSSASSSASRASHDGTEKSATGPCFEYFLNEKILDRLCALGLPDRPLGMRQLITKTLDAILLNTRHPILPSMSVHMAIRQFLDVCYTKEDHKRRGYRQPFLSLLCTITKKIREDNSVAGIFFDIYPAKMNRAPEFLLFTALTAMMSESSEGLQAMQALRVLVQVPNRDISKYILDHSNYIPRVVDSLVHLFQALPGPNECPMMEELVVQVAMMQRQQQQLAHANHHHDPKHPSSSTSPPPSTTPPPHSASPAAGSSASPSAPHAHPHVLPTSYPTITNFFTRWVYIDSLMRTTYPNVQERLGACLREKFLNKLITPLLIDSKETTVSWAMNFVKYLLLQSESFAMKKVMCEYLLGEENQAVEVKPDEKTMTDAAAAPSSTVDMRSILLKRMDSLSDTLCIHTLDLIQTLIGLREPIVIQNLMLRNIVDQHSHHLDILPIPHATMFAHFTDLPDFTLTTIVPQPHGGSSHGTHGVHPHAHSHHHHQQPWIGSIAFEDYLYDAQLEGQMWMRAWEENRIRHEELARALNSTSTEKGETATDAAASTAAIAPSTTAPHSHHLYEGLFYTTLCNKLESLYENSFTTNLKLSLVLSKLAYVPDVHLHQFVFRTEEELQKEKEANGSEVESSSDGAAATAAAGQEEPRLLLSILASLWNKGMKRSSRMQNFARRKEEVRARLNQQVAAHAHQHHHVVGGGSHAHTMPASVSVETMEGERFFRGLILLEELLKEFYAIAHTKARLHALSKLARLNHVTSSTAVESQPSALSIADDITQANEDEEANETPIHSHRMNSFFSGSKAIGSPVLAVEEADEPAVAEPSDLP